MDHQIGTSGLWHQRGFSEQDSFSSELDTFPLATAEFKVGAGKGDEPGEEKGSPILPGLGGSRRNSDVVQNAYGSHWFYAEQ